MEVTFVFPDLVSKWSKIVAAKRIQRVGSCRMSVRYILLKFKPAIRM